MPSFDWLRFFNAHSIDYITEGPNVSHGNVNIRCPFCGVNDPSYHMGVSLNGQGWGCWRDRTHRGKSEVRLVRELLRCSTAHAQALVGKQPLETENFMSRVNQMLDADRVPIDEQVEVQEDPCFKKFSDLPSCKMFNNYMVRRGFKREELSRLSLSLDIRYATRGTFRNRIIFLVKQQNKLVNWTGRTITTNDKLRYKTLTTDIERSRDLNQSPAALEIDETLLWYDYLVSSKHKTLILVEGPFDALKVRYLGSKYGLASTCFFTARPSPSQISLLYEIVPRFEATYLLLDQGTFHTALEVRSELSLLNVKALQLPAAYEDPGALTPAGMAELASLMERQNAIS